MDAVLWDLSLAKQRDLCITVERRAICIALSLLGTYVCMFEDFRGKILKNSAENIEVNIGCKSSTKNPKVLAILKLF